ncbi:Gfo/Idh/MocA family oxidoreductase [Agromyces atrinae]|uniref:Gfo/Idh/MocA family oxidoreductase n=1 Tax=Agromyces atrinae TaxID=592376 RepID=UPI001F5A3F47|nr:Gfo/Idh/MocA family oxidoreductase [Agromyces atrinae]MCI2958495.1 Gfo/Idh/MocA family oxidoreductase [Agromyces atrinae]
MTDSATSALLPLAFGEPGEFREFTVGQVLSGRKTGSTNLRIAYRMSGTPIPVEGERRVLVDSTNRPVAVIRYTRVELTSADDITEDLIVHEASSIAQWRAAHADYWSSLVPAIREFTGDDEWTLGTAEPAIATAFEVVERLEPAPSIAFIGAGFHASRNLLPAAVIAGVRIDAIATRDIDRSRAALRRFGSDGVPYGDAEELLENPAVGRVAVVAQPADQPELVHAAIAHGAAVFVDKPLGTSVDEARSIAAAAERAGVDVVVGFMKRHAPSYRRLRTLIGDGALGDVRSFQLTFGCDSTAFCRTEADFVHLAAIHVIDLVRHLFGEVVDVTTHSNSTGPEVALAVALRFESGVVGSLDLVGLPSYSSETEVLRVVGTRGIATVRDVGELTLHRTGTAAPSWTDLTETTSVHRTVESAMSGIERDLFVRGFVDQMRAFAAGDLTHSSTAADNVRTMELCARIIGHE